MTVEQIGGQPLTPAGQRHVTGALEQLLDEDLGFQSRQMSADADMYAVAEAEVNALVSVRPERLRRGELPLVAVGGGEYATNLSPLRIGAPAISVPCVAVRRICMTGEM